MAETLRIEIPIETVDETADGINSAINGLKKLEKVYRDAGQSARRADQTVSKFDRQAQKTEKRLSRWAKEKYEVFLEAKDRIEPVLQTIGSGLRNITGKTYRVTMKAADFVTAPVRGILRLLSNPVLQAGMVLGVSIGLADTVSTFKDFEAAMSQVEAISGATEIQLGKLTAKAREMGETTKFTAEESAEAMNYMAMAGWKTEDMLGGIEGILNLAAASGEELASTSDIVTDALTAFGLAAADSGHFADVLAAASSNANTNVSMLGESFKYVAPVAGAMKYTIEDTSLALGLMANAGIKGSMAGTSLRSMLTRLASPTSSVADAMTDLGISLADGEGRAYSLRQIMDQLRNSFPAVGKWTQEMAVKQSQLDKMLSEGTITEEKYTQALNEAAMAAFGNENATQAQLAAALAGQEGMSGLLAIVSASEEDYNKLADAIDNASTAFGGQGYAAHQAETMMDNLDGSITRFQSALDGVKLSAGSRIAPYIRGLADWLTAQMPELEKTFDSVMDFADKKINEVKKKYAEVSGTSEWQNADFLGKGKILWNEFITDPLSEWWNGEGRQQVSDIAGQIGNAIGTGLNVGIMTLLGIDVSDTAEAGLSVGASFAKGFSDGFDFKAVSEKLWTGLGSVFKSAGKLLPGGESADIGSVMSMALLTKMAPPVFSAGKGIVNTGKLVRSAFAGSEDSPGLGSMIIGDAAAGTGIRGGLASLGMIGAKMTSTSIGGFSGLLGSQASGLSGAGLIGAGAAGVAGAAAGTAAAVSGAVDAYKAFKSEDADERNAYGASAGMKLGGVATGAAIGTLILPGLGTAIGAGIGGIAGWIAGNKVKESYQEELEEAEKAAANAEKVINVTGRNIENLKFENSALQQAMNDSEVSAEQFASMFREEVAGQAAKAFGTITLSLKEIQKAAREITFADMATGLDSFNSAIGQTEQSLSMLQSATDAMKKEDWKAGLGMKMSTDNIGAFRSSVDAFVDAAQTYISDSHYEAASALQLLIGDGLDTQGLDNFYNGLTAEVETLKAKLEKELKISLGDGIIDIDEAKEIENIQNQISDITDRLSRAKTDAQFESMKIKYSGAALSPDSFAQMQQELVANVQSAQETMDSALTVTLTNLNLQLQDGSITQEDYNNAVAKATEGYYAQINDLNARVESFSLTSIADAMGPALDSILPDIEGTLEEKLGTAMHNALAAHPDVAQWNEADVISWFGLDNIDPAKASVVANDLIMTALAVPEGTKETILESYKSQVPSAEDIKAAIDWNSFDFSMADEINRLLDPSYGEGQSMGAAVSKTTTWAEYYGDKLDAQAAALSKRIHTSLSENTDPAVLQEFMSTYMTNGVSSGIADADMSAINSSIAGLKSRTDTAVDTAFSAGVTTTMPVNVTLDYNISNPTKTYSISGAGVTDGGAITVSAHAAGGYVSSPELSWLAEEGYGEYVIPTNPSRRGTALELYHEAGMALGVGSTKDAGESISYGLTDAGDEPAGTFPVKTSGAGGHVEVHVEVNPEFNIDAGDGKSEEEIVAVIKRHMKELADELGDSMGEMLEDIFSNMPTEEE